MMKKRGVKRRSDEVDMNRQVYVVGLIADTHGLMRPEIERVFAGVDLIVHAGDVGGPHVLAALAAIAPVEAVYGNVDDAQNPALARERVVPVAGLTLHVSHGHECGSPTPELLFARYAADVLVFGHTHRPLVARQGERLAVNPGAAGPRRFDLQPTVARLTIDGRRAEVEIIGLRSGP
jgi:hypothetical protein